MWEECGKGRGRGGGGGGEEEGYRGWFEGRHVAYVYASYRSPMEIVRTTYIDTHIHKHMESGTKGEKGERDLASPPDRVQDYARNILLDVRWDR